MTLSVIIPYFDETIFIRQTVASCLALEDHLHEIIIVNDGLRPFDTSQFSNLFGHQKLQVIHNKRNLGPTLSRNEGLRKASGQYVMFLDADDFLIRDTMIEAIDLARESQADVTHLPTLSYRPQFGAWERFERDHQLLANRRSGLKIDDAPELRYTVATWSWLLNREFLLENELFFDEQQARYADHLYAVRILQAAGRISTFDKYPHVWRRRGESMSTSPESSKDYRNLIGSVSKTAALLARYYDVASKDFQRDLGFFLLRLFAQWTMLQHCIAARSSEPEKAQLLKELASEVRQYPFDKKILQDPILKKIAPSGSGSITLAQIPHLHALLVDEEWEKLAAALGGPPTQTANHTSAILSSDRLGDNSPALCFWLEYSKLLNSEQGFEHRLFSEYLLDVMSHACRIARDTGVTVDTGQTGEWPRNMHTDLAKLARRFDAVAHFPPQAGWDNVQQLCEHAIDLTNQHVTTAVRGDTQGAVVRRVDVLDAWRAWESATLGDALTQIASTVLRRGAEASLGDANWQAQRTLKSRIRTRLIEPLKAN